MRERYDMHCHVSLMSNGSAVAEGAAARGISILAVTVTPADAAAAHRLLDGCPSARVAHGLHPWWLADGRCGERDVARLAETVPCARFIGEIGLDFDRRCASSKEVQLDALARVAAAIDERDIGRRVLSIHAVRSAGAVLDILERHGLVSRHDCIFHWFTGSSDELARARRAGCYFSINEHMLATKRGREYARVIPADRLLLETDAPPALNEPYDAKLLDASLGRTLATVAELRGVPAIELAACVETTSAAIFGA